MKGTGKSIIDFLVWFVISLMVGVLLGWIFLRSSDYFYQHFNKICLGAGSVFVALGIVFTCQNMLEVDPARFAFKRRISSVFTANGLILGVLFHINLLTLAFGGDVDVFLPDNGLVRTVLIADLCVIPIAVIVILIWVWRENVRFDKDVQMSIEAEREEDEERSCQRTKRNYHLTQR